LHRAIVTVTFRRYLSAITFSTEYAYFPLSLRERAGVRVSLKHPHPNLLPEGEGTKIKYPL